MKYVYMYRAEGDEVPLQVSGAYKLAIGVLTVGIVIVGTLFSPWFNWAATAAQAMLF